MVAGEPLSENAYLLRSALAADPGVVGKVRERTKIMMMSALTVKSVNA